VRHIDTPQSIEHNAYVRSADRGSVVQGNITLYASVRHPVDPAWSENDLFRGNQFNFGRRVAPKEAGAHPDGRLVVRVSQDQELHFCSFSFVS
jgi:hypothetical protein